MAEGGGLLPPVLLEIRAKAGEVYSELGKVRSEVSATAKETEGGSTRMQRGFQAAAGAGKALAIGAVGLAGVIGGFSLEAAMSAQVVDAKLRVAIKNAGGSMEEFEPKIKATDARLRGFGYTNDATNTALATLTTAIKDPQKALDAMGVAADLARAKNIPLSDSAALVAKAMEGQTRPLKQLGIDLPTYTGGAQNVKLANQSLATAQLTLNHVLEKYPDAANKASKGHQAYETAALAVKDAQDRVNSTVNAGGTIMKAIEGRVKGAASAYGDTLKGKVDAAKAGLENIGEVIGGKLIPVVTVMIDKASQFAGWLGKHPALLYTLAGIIGGVVVTAIVAYTVSMVSAAYATIAATWPILAIIAAVIAVGVAIYELVTHWTTVWNAIKAAASAVWDWMKGLWSWISGIFVAGFETAIHGLETAWSTVWNGLKSAASTVWDWLKTVWSWIKTIFLDAFMGYLHLLGIVWGGVWDGIKAVLNVAWNSVIKPIWGWIKGGISDIKGFLSDMGGVFKRIWDDVSGVLSKAWNGTVGFVLGAIKGAIDGISGAIQGVIGWIQSVIGWFSRMASGAHDAATAVHKAGGPGSVGLSGLQFMGLVPHFDDGGFVNAPRGKPQLGLNHGGEYMLSTDMLAGRQPIDPRVKAAVEANGPSMSQAALTGGPPSTARTGGNTVIVNAHTDADPKRIASAVGWELRAMA